jgi:multidrug efflux pump subunit AcrA (membrane-fusion protein)
MTTPSLLLSRLQTLPSLRTLAGPAGILTLALLGSVSLFATGPSPDPAPRTERAWPVSILEVEPGPARPALTGFGRVESTRQAALGTDLSLRVRTVHVREGDWAAAGDVLVELDDAEIALLLAQREADLAQARAQLQALESERGMLETTLAQVRSMHRLNTAKLERHQTLRARSLIAQSLVDEVQAQADQTSIQLQTHEYRLAELPHRLAAQRAQVEKARALVELAGLELERTRIRAPFTGPILAVPVAEGDRTQPGATLVEIAAADSYEVRVQVSAAQGARFQAHLERGEPVSVRLATADAGTLRLPLVRVAGRVRPGQSGLDTFFALPATAGRGLPPLGRTIDLEIELPEQPDVVALPFSALYENDRIYAVEAERLEAIDVERVGESRDATGELRVLVRAPALAGGRRVVTTQLPRAMPGLLVEAS